MNHTQGKNWCRQGDMGYVCQEGKCEHWREFSNCEELSDFRVKYGLEPIKPDEGYCNWREKRWWEQ